MDYARFRSEREALLARGPALRLDCMNPARALERWRPSEPADDVAAASVEELLLAWNAATGIGLSREQARLERGVRALLEELLPVLAADAAEVWLPEDVYPVYWNMPRGTAAACAFRTLPAPDWSFLARTHSAATLLLPAPLAPLGRWLTPREVELLHDWLAGSSRRRLVLDAAYCYDFGAFARKLAPLLAAPGVVWIASLRKPWLCADTLGIARVPRELAHPHAALGDRMRARAVTLLRTARDLPLRQARAFEAEWQRLAPAIRAADPAWQPPESGYFGVVRADFRELFERHGLLCVPASVFGSSRPDLSVVSCLFALGAPPSP
ncbi:MAG: hypothetical protein ABL998_12515 [Planctomycetota bacterium]